MCAAVQHPGPCRRDNSGTAFKVDNEREIFDGSDGFHLRDIISRYAG
jgi:hypothetical protein